MYVHIPTYLYHHRARSWVVIAVARKMVLVCKRHNSSTTILASDAKSEHILGRRVYRHPYYRRIFMFLKCVGIICFFFLFLYFGACSLYACRCGKGFFLCVCTTLIWQTTCHPTTSLRIIDNWAAHNAEKHEPTATNCYHPLYTQYAELSSLLADALHIIRDCKSVITVIPTISISYTC